MVDRIVVIADGQISEMGTYRELISRDGPFAQLLHTLAQEDSPTDDESDESKHFIFYTNGLFILYKTAQIT
jgi:hypothetical protein